MGDINDDWYESRSLEAKRRDKEIKDRLKYLNELTFEQKIDIMFEQYKKDEQNRIWDKYRSKY